MDFPNGSMIKMKEILILLLDSFVTCILMYTVFYQQGHKDLLTIINFIISFLVMSLVLYTGNRVRKNGDDERVAKV
jgi:uncharacterized membrane protein